ncbi:phage tail protein [Pseudomonas mandelii]|nr:phage tail protein [Pseudomonas mandelii]
MIDANSQFFAILTNVGMAKQANADALGIPWKLTEMGVGDANLTDPIPSATQTQLIREWRRRPLNQLKIDPANPAVIIAEQVIPADEGGFWIREIGLYDADGDLVAVANCAPSFKPVLSQGSGRTQVVRMNFIVSSAANITLKIDPSVVLATREYVDSKVLEELYKLDSKQSVRVATTANIALAGLQPVDGVALVAGDRVLVKNQTVAKDNGLYIVAAGVWPRALDADSSAEVTSALVVAVEQGATLADSRWQLVTDGVIILGSTSLVFQDVTQGYAPINSPAFLGSPTANTAPAGSNTRQLANAEFVRTAVHGSTFIDISGAGTLALTAAEAGTGTLTLFGALTGNRTIVVPTVQTRLQVVNSTTGAFSLTVKTAAGAGVAVTQGTSTLLFVTGANTIAQQQSDFDSIAMTGNPTTPTPAAGDNDKSVANTEFVQRAKGGYRGFTVLTAAAALTVADIGNLVSVNGTFTVTLPASNLVNRGEAIHFRNVGDGAVTVACAGADIIDAGGIALANITLQPGASLELVNAGGTNWWASGSAQLQYSTVRESFGGVIGDVRNGRMSVTAPSLTATYKADELLVMASYGGLHRLVGVNKSINLSAVGAGGMGVAGGAPVNGWLGIYVVYNPDTKAMALVGVNGTPGVLSEKCPPASLPAGYTASALVAVVPINASGQFPVLEVVDREVMTYKSIYGGLVATLTPVSLTASVPPNAKSINMNAASTVNAAGQCTVIAAGTAAGSANPGFTTYVGQSTAAGQNVTFTFRDVPLFTTQYIWLQATGPLTTTQFNCYGYKF